MSLCDDTNRFLKYYVKMSMEVLSIVIATFTDSAEHLVFIYVYVYFGCNVLDFFKTEVCANWLIFGAISWPAFENKHDTNHDHTMKLTTWPALSVLFLQSSNNSCEVKLLGKMTSRMGWNQSWQLAGLRIDVVEDSPRKGWTGTGKCAKWRPIQANYLFKPSINDFITENLFFNLFSIKFSKY